nr:hypothetical protein [uncultured Sphingomonas sp.]
MAGFATLMLFAMAAQDRPVLVPGGEDLDIVKSEARSCGTDPDEIVVCGENDPNRYRLPKIGPRFVEQPVRAATRLGPGELSVEAEQRTLPGAGGPAAMVRFRIPLGKSKK